MKILHNLGARAAGLLLVLLLPAWGAAQQINLSGKISDETGDVLVGANVSILGTGIGTYTNIDGEYQLRGRLAAGTYTLRVAYIGYANQDQRLTVAAEGLTQKIDVAMAANDGMNLDEVVVTGSTLTSSRRQLGNALYTVGSEQLQRTGSTDALASLQGKVAGAQITQNSGDPAGGISVRLRGVNSIRGNSDPLYVIDGVIVSNTTANVSQIAVDGGAAALGTNRLVDINPKDIESVTVINGAAAAAQYGSRASNGVVLITTKRGKSGRPEITFTTSMNINELRKEVPISTYGKQFGSAGLRLHTIANNAAATTDFVTVAGRKLATNQVNVRRFDYQDLIFDRGMGTENNLSVAGGNDKTRYFASVGYTKNEGIVRNTDFQRVNLRLNLDQQLADWAKLAVGMTYSNSFSNELPNGNVFYSPINAVNITNNVWRADSLDANGLLQAVEPTRVNPVSIVETFDITQAVNRGGGNVQLSLFPLKGLKLDWISGVDAYSQLGKTYIPVYPYAGVNPAYYNLGFAGNANSLNMLFNTDLNLTYDFDIAKKLHSTTTAGYNYQYNQSDYSVSSGQNLAPAIETVNGAAATVSSYGLDRFAISGYFLQETFGFDNQLFITLAGRVDGSTKFSEDQQNQFYPKASASWVVSENSLWGKTFGKAWNGLKLRASWGEAGGLNAIGTYDRFWQFTPANFLGKNTIVPSTQFANPEVKPERTRELELGADFSFWSSRVNLGLTWYKQQVEDLVVNRVLASSSGARSIVNNLGEMENKGIEATLGLNLVRRRDLNWEVNAVFSRNENLITRAGSPLVPINNVAGAPIFVIEGQPASVFFGAYQAQNADGSDLLMPHPDGASAGLLQVEKGSIATYTGQEIPAGGYVIGGTLYTPQRDATTGQPTGSQLRNIIGDPNPDFTASLGTTLTWKKLSFGFLLDGVYGNDVFNADKRTRQGVGIGDLAEKELRGDLPRGWIWAMYPVESWRVDDGSFTKLREISFSYNFGKLVKGLNDLSLTLVGRNLHSWDNYNGYDPETNAGGNSDLMRGVDFGNVPIPRTYQASLTARF
jgi:TonB-linked SusC/RagA family outer membrane protein